MAQRTAVLNIVALTPSLIGEHAPRLRAFRDSSHLRTLKPDLPAVTTTSQASMLTGRPPREHGIVGNGWYNREYAEVHFWKQSNHLVRAPKVWETARDRDSSVTCAKMFWWYNMYASADWSVTPRPMYKADGRKIPDCYSEPPHLRDALQGRYGQFPLFNFWGPTSSIASSQWIANATRDVVQQFDPTLTLVYLPHLDYALQKFGLDTDESRQAVGRIDAVAGDLIDYFHERDTCVIIVSEYGIEPVTDAVHINRVLRESGALRVRVEQGGELLDAGASDAFAVADHQIAHVYVRDDAKIAHYAEMLRGVDGVEEVLDRAAQAEYGLDHERAGDLVLVAERGRWFSYYYWLDDARAPDFARCVDIHRKPGYDPVELFVDPAIRFPRALVAWKLLRKKLGFRMLMDVIPLDASLVRGSHGRVDLPPDEGPLLITEDEHPDVDERPSCRKVHDVILETMFSRA